MQTTVKPSEGLSSKWRFCYCSILQC